MDVDREQIDEIEKLARLELTQDEKETLQHQLTRILEHVESIGELDLEDVDPLTDPLDLENVERTDEPREGLSVEEALQNAPEHDGSFFHVPRVIDSE